MIKMSNKDKIKNYFFQVLKKNLLERMLKMNSFCSSTVELIQKNNTMLLTVRYAVMICSWKKEERCLHLG